MNLDISFSLTRGFENVSRGVASLADVCDTLRTRLNMRWPVEFSWGSEISVNALLLVLLEHRSPVLTSRLWCSAGHPADRGRVARSSRECCVLILAERTTDIQQYLDDGMAVQTHASCRLCHSAVVTSRSSFVDAPSILSFDLCRWEMPKINDTVTINTAQETAKYLLKGVIYHHDHHFTSRIVGPGNMVWFHDGLVAQSSGLVYEGLLSSLPDIRSKGPMRAVSVVYFLEGRTDL